MGKRTLWTGVIVGAAVGGLVTLFNSETREYVKNTADKAVGSMNYYANHPDIGVNQIKQGVDSVSRLVADNTDSAMNVLSQAENSLQKFLK